MTQAELNKKLKVLNSNIKYYDIKVNNKSGYWQPDQIENWKIERYKSIKKAKQLKHDYPEFFL